MLVSATIRGTLPAATKLLDGAHDARLSHADFPGPAGAVALEPTPALLLAVAAQRLPEDLCLGAVIAVAEEVAVGEAVVVGALPASRRAASGDTRQSTRCRPEAVTAREDRGVERSGEYGLGDTRRRSRPVTSVERAPQ